MTDHDFNGNESVIPSDIEYTLSRIGTIADSVDSSMTVGEIVRRAYLCGVGDTLDEFRKLVDRRTLGPALQISHLWLCKSRTSSSANLAGLYI